MDEQHRFIITFVLVIMSFTAHAGIVIDSTRVIYSADKKEVTVNLRNTGTHPSLVQSWIDTGDPLVTPGKNTVPFVIMPPITRIDGGKGQTLRLIYTGKPLPDDRESIFWLNVLAVPPKKSDSRNHLLNVAYQTRIKLFFRPSALNFKADDAAQKLQWKNESGALSVFNPTPYNISLLNVEWMAAGKTVSVAGEMVSPFGQARLATAEIPAGVSGVDYTIIDDLGREQKLSSALK